MAAGGDWPSCWGGSTAARLSPILQLVSTHTHTQAHYRAEGMTVMDVVALMGKELMVFLLFSSTAAKLLRTWLCLQVYRPCVRLVLQPVRMCLRVPGVGQRAQVGSSPYHWWRFFGDGSRSLVALMMKLMLLASISQRSLQPSFLPPHPLSLFGKRDSLCSSFSLLLAAHLLHHHFPSLRR